MTTVTTIHHPYSGKTITVRRPGSVEDAERAWSCDCEISELFEHTPLGVCLKTGTYEILSITADEP